jgi:hypothetical protein
LDSLACTCPETVTVAAAGRERVGACAPVWFATGPVPLNTDADQFGCQALLAAGMRYSRATCCPSEKLALAVRNPRTMSAGEAPACGGFGIS